MTTSLYDTGGWASVGPTWVWINPNGKHPRTFKAGEYTTRRKMSRKDFEDLTRDATQRVSLQDPLAFMAAYKEHLADLEHTDHIAKAALEAAANDPDAVAFWQKETKKRHNRRTRFFSDGINFVGNVLESAAEISSYPYSAAISDQC